ncbi:hypothetical protein BB413_04500 [Helicobacter pylori]|uniref:Uncharacterized protein n=1 Tax=Helicobacter pylori TaxID=210 RepID=A0A2A6XH46_HELPX|nr:hypothetical protein BB413_04500 [Helicobacter pylori]
MLNIGYKGVKSVFKIQLKAFKSNAKKQKMTQFFQNYKKKKKRFHAIIYPCLMHQNTNLKRRT